MKRLIIKTAAITVAAIIVITTAAYFLIAIFSPKTLATGWKAVGNYEFSLKYYEKQYQKTETLEDLAELCGALDAKNDSGRTEKYLAIFTAKEDFSKYCEKEDEKGGFKMTAYEYYYGRYTVAAFYKNGIKAAVDIAKSAFGNKYTENNSFYILLIEVETLGSSEGKAISSAVSSIKTRLSDAKQKEYAARDIELADSLT